tara:strand:- start:820 stop:1236 length:417 start_codon:yes stop_codon:yes gene_type:complete
MNSIEKIQKDIVEEFNLFDDWQEKYEHLIELGKEMEILPKKHKNESNIIEGCQSNVWIVAEFKNKKIKFLADSDAIITKGIISLLLRVFSEQSPLDILNANYNFIELIGLKKHLSINRASGLESMINKIKEYALIFNK